MRAFVWYEHDSFLHRLNPLTKLGICLPVVVIASASFEPVTPVAMALAALLVTHFVGGVPWARLLRPLLFAGPLSVGFLWSGTVFYAGPGSGADAPGISLGPLWLPTTSQFSWRDAVFVVGVLVFLFALVIRG